MKNWGRYIYRERQSEREREEVERERQREEDAPSANSAHSDESFGVGVCVEREREKESERLSEREVFIYRGVYVCVCAVLCVYRCGYSWNSFKRSTRNSNTKSPCALVRKTKLLRALRTRYTHTHTHLCTYIYN
jgi:hypothetical protein